MQWCGGQCEDVIEEDKGSCLDEVSSMRLCGDLGKDPHCQDTTCQCPANTNSTGSVEGEK